jgi:phage shock protein C
MSRRYSETHRTLYRSRGGWIFGVCQGLADYSEIDVKWVRLATIIAVFMTALWPMVIIYIMAAIFIKPAPYSMPEDVEDWEFYNTYSTDRKMALLRLKRKFDVLERRARRIEGIVTTPEYRWDREINR